MHTISHSVPSSRTFSSRGYNAPEYYMNLCTNDYTAVDRIGDSSPVHMWCGNAIFEKDTNRKPVSHTKSFASLWVWYRKKREYRCMLLFKSSKVIVTRKCAAAHRKMRQKSNESYAFAMDVGFIYDLNDVTAIKCVHFTTLRFVCDHKKWCSHESSKMWFRHTECRHTIKIHQFLWPKNQKESEPSQTHHSSDVYVRSQHIKIIGA